MSLEIAKTIKHQLTTLGAIQVMSWGSHVWTGGKDFLAFRVQGFKFKGIVKITLTPMDVYEIEFIKGRFINGTPEHKRENVYFDEMVDIIDEYVEHTGANYENDIRKSFMKGLN